MDIKEFKKLQKEFEDKYIGHFSDNPDDLLFFATALAGELGEFANLVKKYYRQEKLNTKVTTDDKRDYKPEMKEEIIDIFTYLLIVANILDIDIEKEYLAKLEKNKQRFQKI